MTRFGHDLEQALATPDVLARIAETAAAEEERRRLERLTAHAIRLVDELRALPRRPPPVLADHGLAAALRALLRRLDGEATLDVGSAVHTGRYPTQVETTAYVCCQAAIQASTDAGATAIAVRQADHRDGQHPA